MLFQLKKLIQNVSYFEEKKGYYVTKNKVKNAFDDNIELNFDNSNSIFDFDDRVIILDYLNKPYFISENNPVAAFDSEIRINANKFPYIGFYKKAEKRVYGIYDYAASKILFETFDWIGRDIIGSYILGVSDNIISCRSVYSPHPLWQYPLKNLGTYVNYRSDVNEYVVEKFLGLWKNELIVSCSNSLILSLDIIKGKEIRRWQKLEGYYPDIKGVANLLPRTQNFVFDEESQKLLAIHIRSLVTIDLNSGEIEIADLEPTLTSAISYRCVFNNHTSYGLSATHIFTTVHLSDDQSQFSYDALVAINRRTLKIDWIYQFDKDGVGTNAPVCNNEKLYQLTLNHNLYIFQQKNM